MLRIDVHAHYFPRAFLDALDCLSGHNTMHARQGGAGDSDVEIAGRLALMDSAGVDLQVLSVSTLFPYAESQAAAVDTATLANDLYADLTQRMPARFAAFGVLPLPHVEASITEAARCLDELGMVGVTLGTSILGRRLSDPEFDPLFAELNRRAAVVFIHPAGVGACSPLLPLTGIGPIIEDTMAITHLVDAGTVVRYPDLRIIASHLGGALPLLAERMDRHRENFNTQLSEPPSVTFRRLWFDTVAHGSLPALRCARDVYGADRLLLGSDFPYATDDPYRRAVKYIETAGLAELETAGILGENARKLLRLGNVVGKETASGRPR